MKDFPNCLVIIVVQPHTFACICTNFSSESKFLCPSNSQKSATTNASSTAGATTAAGGSETSSGYTPSSDESHPMYPWLPSSAAGDAPRTLYGSRFIVVMHLCFLHFILVSVTFLD